jgi:hypothetical protein
MASYSEIIVEVESKFGSVAWTSNDIKTYPADYNGDKAIPEYITISLVIGKSDRRYGGGKGPQRGALICEIYTPSGQGQRRSFEISDLIDDLLENKRLETSGVDFSTSFVGTPAVDTANLSLSRAIYTLPFQTY